MLGGATLNTTVAPGTLPSLPWSSVYIISSESCVLWQVLCSWLSNSPNYEEITKWYLGWKSMFSDQVLAHPSVKDKFNEALDIMNRAVSSNVGE
jgi:hypothetical protein